MNAAGELVSREAAEKLVDQWDTNNGMALLDDHREDLKNRIVAALPPVARVPDGHFDPAPHTEASRNDPEELLCVACGKPVWAHSCNRPPLGVARVPETKCAGMLMCGFRDEAGGPTDEMRHDRRCPLFIEGEK